MSEVTVRAAPVGTPAPVRPTRSIVKRLMLAFTISVALSSVATVVALAAIDTRRRGTELNKDADDAVRALAHVMEPALWDIDMDRAAQIGKAFAEDPRVVRLAIVDNSTGGTREIRHGALTDTVARALPVMHEGRMIGTVELALSREPLRRAIREEVDGVLRASLVALLVAFLVVRFLVRRLLDAPLDELAANVATYHDGTSAPTTMALRYEEFETLHEVLDTMRARIALQLRELQASNVRLTDEVEGHRHADEALARRNCELASLNRFMALAVTDVPFTFLMSRACEEITTSLGLTYGIVGLLDSHATTFTPLSRSGGEAGPLPAGAVVDLSQMPLAAAFKAARAPLLFRDVRADARLGAFAEGLDRAGIGSLAAFPIVVEGDTIGAIIIGTPEVHDFTDAEVSLAVGITTQAATAIARYRANAAQHLLRAAIEQSPDCVMISDIDGCFVYVNEAFTTLTGYSSAEALAAPPGLLRNDAHPTSFYATIWDSLRRGETWRGRITNRRRDGRDLVVDAIMAPVRDEIGTTTNYIAIESDMTEQLVSEQRFQHAQRMDAVGQLAGGIAHDFNNILGAIILELELLEVEHSLPDAVRQVTSDVRASAQRAANLTRQLLMFSRRQVMTMRAHDLNVVVSDLLRMLSRLIGEQVVIDFGPTPQPAVFEGDAGMIEQVIMNLCLNARDAMPSGGTLTVRTRLVTRDGDAIPQPSDAVPGRFALLEVGDTGSGMSGDTLSHLFEPFFTTKDVGKGTGLGLATAHGLIAQHRGWIEVESVLGAGSTFRVYLPALDTEAAAPVPDPVIEAIASPATVLLVEDEAPVRRVVCRGLRRLGYHVLEAGDGVEALRVWREAGGDVQLLLADMVMPEDLSGLDLALQLRAEQPSLRVVIMSGYDIRLLGDNSRLMEDIEFLGKPFSIVSLGEVVTRQLGTT
ncbi:hypothetical protein BH11GEM1_BH11GEM1_19420 [soil metagenome]